MSQGLEERKRKEGHFTDLLSFRSRHVRLLRSWFGLQNSSLFFLFYSNFEFFFLVLGSASTFFFEYGRGERERERERERKKKGEREREEGEKGGEERKGEEIETEEKSLLPTVQLEL